MPSIFITGGAAGIGLATAERFSREGWTVGVYDVDADGLAKVKANHPEWITGTLDVRDEKQWAQALEEFTSHTGGTLDVLDNNAGILVAGLLPKKSLAQVFIMVACALLAVGVARMLAVPVFLTLFLMGAVLAFTDRKKSLSYTELPDGHWLLAIILFVVVGASLPWHDLTGLAALQALGLLGGNGWAIGMADVHAAKADGTD